jgi:hypothetical protein
MKRIIMCASLACILALASFAEGGVAPKTLGVFGSISADSYLLGLSYQATNTFALKPAIGFSSNSQPDNNKSTNFQLFTRIDGLFQLPLTSALIMGMGPRIGYNLAYTTSDTGTITTTGNDGHFIIGAVANVQYLFTKNFGAFLDASLTADFESNKTTQVYDASTTPIPNTTSSTTTLATSTSLGLIFYF